MLANKYPYLLATMVLLLAILACSLTPVVAGVVERTKDDNASVNMPSYIYTSTAIVPHVTATPRQWYGDGKRTGTP